MNQFLTLTEPNGDQYEINVSQIVSIHPNCAECENGTSIRTVINYTYCAKETVDEIRQMLSILSKH